MKRIVSFIIAVFLTVGIMPVSVLAVPETPSVEILDVVFELEKAPSVGDKIVLPKVTSVNGGTDLINAVDISASYWAESDVALSFAQFERVSANAKFQSKKAYKLCLSVKVSGKYYFVTKSRITVKTPEEELAGVYSVSGFDLAFQTMINFGAPNNYITVNSYDIKLFGYKAGAGTTDLTADVYINGEKKNENAININKDVDKLCISTSDDLEKLTIKYEDLQQNKQYYLLLFSEEMPNYLVDYTDLQRFSVNGIKAFKQIYSDNRHILFFKLPILHTHSYVTKYKKATTAANGKIYKECKICGYVASKSTVIKKINSVKLSGTAYTYNGNIKKPAVTVKNSDGKTISSKYYTVTYASGRKNVGKYKVTVKFKGNYSGTKTLYFTINPAKTTVKSLTAGSKRLTVSITKKSTQVTGYQIQYSTSKKFSSYKTKTISSYKTTKATLSSLKAKTTYYVRVRTHKTVNGVKYYSGWSTVKYKKTK